MEVLQVNFWAPWMKCWKVRLYQIWNIGQQCIDKLCKVIVNLYIRMNHLKGYFWIRCSLIEILMCIIRIFPIMQLTLRFRINRGARLLILNFPTPPRTLYKLTLCQRLCNLMSAERRFFQVYHAYHTVHHKNSGTLPLTGHSYVDLSSKSITLMFVQLIINPKPNQITKNTPKCIIISNEFST